jgi:hypothetical protein
MLGAGRRGPKKVDERFVVVVADAGNVPSSMLRVVEVVEFEYGFELQR